MPTCQFHQGISGVKLNQMFRFRAHLYNMNALERYGVYRSQWKWLSVPIPRQIGLLIEPMNLSNTENCAHAGQNASIQICRIFLFIIEKYVKTNINVPCVDLHNSWTLMLESLQSVESSFKGLFVLSILIQPILSHKSLDSQAKRNIHCKSNEY